ncbi:hypothetical protein AMTRI_Chr01g110510 [Amborella trichopoda]
MIDVSLGHHLSLNDMAPASTYGFLAQIGKDDDISVSLEIGRADWGIKMILAIHLWFGARIGWEVHGIGTTPSGGMGGIGDHEHLRHYRLIFFVDCVIGGDWLISIVFLVIKS